MSGRSLAREGRPYWGLQLYANVPELPLDKACYFRFGRKPAPASATTEKKAPASKFAGAFLLRLDAGFTAS